MSSAVCCCCRSAGSKLKWTHFSLGEAMLGIKKAHVFITRVVLKWFVVLSIGLSRLLCLSLVIVSSISSIVERVKFVRGLAVF